MGSEGEQPGDPRRVTERHRAENRVETSKKKYLWTLRWELDTVPPGETP